MKNHAKKYRDAYFPPFTRQPKYMRYINHRIRDFISHFASRKDVVIIMNHFSLELSLTALVPALFLCGYIFYKDKIEKEPLGLLALLFAAGGVAFVPSIFAQKFIIEFIDGLFEDKMSFSPEGLITFSSVSAEIAHNVLCAVLGFSLVQIALKWVVLFIITHKNKNFNYLFDGIVYSVFVSLGFAVAENVHFIIQNDTELLLPKLLTSVPCHLFVGVLMGHYYTMWHIRYQANGIENDLIKAGEVKKDNIRSSAIWLFFSIIVPIFINGIYSFAVLIGGDIAKNIFYLAIFVFYALSFVVIERIASNTDSSMRYLCRIISKGHPELSRERIEEIVNNGVDGDAGEVSE